MTTLKKINQILTGLTLAMQLTSCGQAPRGQSQNIDDALAPYLKAFETQARIQSVSVDASHLTMTFNESMPPSTIPNATVWAYCTGTNDAPSVVVKGSVFNSLSVSDREQLVFHELGHCLLGLQHNESIEPATWFGTNSYATTVPSSIMNPLHFDSGLYEGNRSQYMFRLFHSMASSPLYWNAPSQFDSTIYQ